MIRAALESQREVSHKTHRVLCSMWFLVMMVAIPTVILLKIGSCDTFDLHCKTKQVHYANP